MSGGGNFFNRQLLDLVQVGLILPLTPSLNKFRNTLEVNWPCSQFLVYNEKPTTILKIRNSENTVTVKTVKSQVHEIQKKNEKKKTKNLETSNYCGMW